eukprot:1149266-Pelagomonas_calceolata.AAC.1
MPICTALQHVSKGWRETVKVREPDELFASVLLTTCFARSNPYGRLILVHPTEAGLPCLQENYGKHDPKSVAAIKAIFNEVGLEEKFKAYEADSYKHLCSRIEEQKALPKGVFTSLLQKIYKRSK